MKTCAVLFPRGSSSIAIFLALACLLFGTAKSRAQSCDYTTTGTNVLQVSFASCFTGNFNWAISADPTSSASSSIFFTGSNYYPEYNLTNGGVTVTLTATMPLQGGTQTYTVWREQTSNIKLSNVIVIIKDDQGNDVTSQCTVDTSGFAGPTSGTITVTWLTPCPGVSITGHPADQSINAGATATYTVTATGSGLTYQWRKNAGNIAGGPTGNGSTYSGATSNVLTIANAAVADTALASAGYDCVVTTSVGNCSVVSGKAALNVQGQGNCTNNILGIVDNQNGTFTLTFAGLPNAQYYAVSSTDVLLPMAQWTVLTDSTNTADAGGTWTYTTAANPTPPPFKVFRAVATNPCP